MRIKFKRDTAFRKQFFVPDSFAHPAKMDAQLLIWIVEHYTEAGETILDPMAGSGTSMLACTLGRDVILVELEEKFCKMMRDNWEQVKMRPQLGSTMGNCQIIQGDARNLKEVLYGDASGFANHIDSMVSGEDFNKVDKIVTSPPYGIPATSQESSKNEIERRIKRGIAGATITDKGEYMTGDGRREQTYSENPNNISNLPYGEIDKCIFSPPYEEAMGEKHHSPRADKLAKEKSNPTTYTGQIDKIVTSPPYEGSISDGAGNFDWTKKEWEEGEWREYTDSHVTGYGKSDNNIGNLKSQSYLKAMLQVYQQCFSVLRDGGLMILVTKNFIRNKQVVRLDEDTIKLCEQAGFSFVERHHRELPAQSFWRIIYSKKFPDVEQIKSEDVLVFVK